MLFLTFLFFLQVGCEWVEISQQHYKKPLRSIHSHPLLTAVEKPSEVKKATQNRVIIAAVDKTSENLPPPVVKESDERAIKRKPLRPTDNSPSTVVKLSDIELKTNRKPLRQIDNTRTSVKVSDIEPSNNRRPLRPTDYSLSPIKVSEMERTTKRNRIYINHTLQQIPDNNWGIDLEEQVPANVNRANIKGSVVNFKEKHDPGNRKSQLSDELVLHEDKVKEDVLIIRKSKPEVFENGSKTDKPSGHRTSIAGNVMRVRPTNNKGLRNKPKPLEDYKGPIEVLNMSDLEYTTAEDTLQFKIDKDKANNDKDIESNAKHNHVTTSTTSHKIIERPNMESSKYNNSNYERKSTPNHESNTKLPTTLKGVTNMRRVEILRSTKPSPLEDYGDYDTNRPASSSKPKLTIEDTTKTKEIGSSTTTYSFPNLGIVKRVHIANNITRPTYKPKPAAKYSTTESVIEEDYSTDQSETIENDIRRIDKPMHRSTTEKSIPLKRKLGKPTLKNRDQNHQVPSPEDVMLEELITEDEKQPDIKVHKVASIGTVKRVPNPTKAPEDNKKKLDRPDSIKQIATPTSVIETDDEVTVEDEDSSEQYSNDYNNHDFTSSTEKVPVVTTPKIKRKMNSATRRPEINPQIEKYDPNLYKPIKHNEQPEFVTKDDYHYETEPSSDSNLRTYRIKIKAVNQHTKQKENQSKNNSNKNSTPQNQANIRIDNNNNEDETDDPLSSDRKNNAMENLIKFLKTVTDIIARNTRRGVHSKLRYLEDLRDTILANIEERLEAAFPDDSPGPGAPGAPGARHARSAEPRGHVEFPSSEGALMTISFLTFAVFLIKLVLQVIQAYKNKTMMMMPTVVAAVGRAYNERYTKN